MQHSLLLLPLLLSLVLTTTTTSSQIHTDTIGFRLQLTRSHSKRVNPNGLMRVFPSEGEYAVDLAIGTPPQPMRSIVDSGSDLIWTQCANCKPCFKQPLPLFDPSKSSSFSHLSCASKFCKGLDALNRACARKNDTCNYGYQYGDGSFTKGKLSSETLTVESEKGKKVQIPNVAFGCSDGAAGNMTNTTGIIGFARGPLSFVSQLRLGKFSYCFTSAFDGKKAPSPMFFGSQAKLSGPGIQTTPFKFHRPPALSLLYYINITGIAVGRMTLPAPPVEFDSAGNGGTIIDSGTDITFLHHAAFENIVTAFRLQVKLPYVNGSRTCFESKNNGKEDMPRFAYLMEGGARWEMPRENYVTYDREKRWLCVLVEDGGTMTILGNIFMQNFHVLYDLKEEKLSFQPARCDQL